MRTRCGFNDRPKKYWGRVYERRRWAEKPNKRDKAEASNRLRERESGDHGLTRAEAECA